MPLLVVYVPYTCTSRRVMNRLGNLQRYISHGLRFFLLYTITIYTVCQGACIQPSCLKSSFSIACLFCENDAGELLNLRHFLDPNIRGAFNNELKTYGTVWIDSGTAVPQCLNKSEIQDPSCKSTTLKLNDSAITKTEYACSNEFYFFCYRNDSQCGTCAMSTDKTTTRTTASVPAPQNTSSTVSARPHTQDKGTAFLILITMVVFGFICLVAIVTGLVCFLCRRRKKLAQDPVREESACAMYRAKNPETEIETVHDEEKDVTMDEDKMLQISEDDRAEKPEPQLNADED